jgi:two-component system cell cycle sensor histidine kinase/response regulator CckA
MIRELEAPPPLAAPPCVTLQAEWWGRLFEGAEDAQFVCAADGSALDCNRRAQKLFGLSGLEKCPPDALFSALSPPVARRVAGLLARGTGGLETLPSVTLSCGGKLVLMADLSVLPLAENYSLVAVKDTSRRRRMESHVQRLASAINATPDVFFLTDAEFRLTFVNVAFEHATGHNIEEALGRTPDFLRTLPSREVQKECFARVREGADWMGELINVRSDGSTYPVETTVSPIHDRTSALLGFVFYERDVSAKKKLQEEVLLERDFARSIIHSLDSAIYTVDRDLRLAHVNEDWKKMPPQHGWLSITEPPELGQPLLDHVPDLVKRAELQALFETVLASRSPREVQAVSPGGRHWLVKVSPWQHAGEVIGLIYHVVDQTSVHQLQNQLLQSQKMEMIGALAAGVAHDFNNLLQAIRGNVSLLLPDPRMDESCRPRLEKIEQAAVRATAITSQLLSFSRASEEKAVLLDFNEVIREASDLARRSLKGGVEIQLNPWPSPVKVRMDASRASQLLLNLCVNAQDAMPKGGRLTLTNIILPLTPEQAPRTQSIPGSMFVRCSVADTGEGIPPEVLPRIFDAFFTTKEVGKGTGLGLSIVHRVVTQAGGFVEIQTALGHGTTFHIYFPAAAGALDAPKKVSGRLAVKGTGRILAVDDLDLVRDFAQAFLRMAGFEVMVASSGEEALETLTTQDSLGRPFDLLFTDFNMPGANGIELIEETSRRWPKMRFILASGYLQEAERDRIERILHVRVLQKPFDPREASDLVLEILAARPAG